MRPTRMFGDAERQAEWEESQARYAVEQEAIDAADRDREVPRVRDRSWLDDEFNPTRISPLERLSHPEIDGMYVRRDPDRSI